MMFRLRLACIALAILASGGLFGFFYTMSFSIIPGLDDTPAYSALIANQMIGRATQGSSFIVLLLGAPAMIIAAIALSLPKAKRLALPWLVAALLCWIGMVVVTLTLDVPLNQALDGLALHPGMPNAEEAWLAYSPEWQQWNFWRVGFSAVSTALATVGIVFAIKVKTFE